MQLFDVHTHILPAFDDGAKTIEDSLELIACLKKQGICNICLTPHFYTHEQSVEDFLESRNAAFAAFEPHIPSDIRIILGAEVYVTDYLFNSDSWQGISYGKSPYILTEFPYNSTFSNRTLRQLEVVPRARLVAERPQVDGRMVLEELDHANAPFDLRLRPRWRVRQRLYAVVRAV